MFANIIASVLSCIQPRKDIFSDDFLQQFFCFYGFTVSNILNTHDTNFF